MGNGLSPQLVPANNRMQENTAAVFNAANDKVRKSHRSESLFCFPTSFHTHFCLLRLGTYLQWNVSSGHVDPLPLWLQSILIPSIGTLTRSGTSVLLLCVSFLKGFKLLLTSHHNNNTQDTSPLHHISCHHFFFTDGFFSYVTSIYCLLM